jgi:hypothetical protein
VRRKKEGKNRRERDKTVNARRKKADRSREERLKGDEDQGERRERDG